MGNSQSTSERPNRLSKPKTNTNSPCPPLASDSPVSVSSKLSTKGRQQIRETLLPPVDTEPKPTAWTDKNGNILGELAPQTRGRPTSMLSRSNSRVHSRSNSMSCFGSKHGSATKLNELHGSKISLVSNTQMDVDAAIRLLQEVKKNASPEDLAALHEALEPSGHDPATSAEPGLSRRTSTINRSSSSLTRRRSLLQTPGVATRNSPVEGRRRTWNSWKAPKVAPEEEAKWAVTPKGITPLNNSLAVGLAEGGRGTPTPRAQTPGELDYAHLGSLKLGTLSIVNGAPSPAPSAKITKSRSAFGGEADYFTSADSGSSPLMMKTTRRGHIKSKSANLPAPTPLPIRNRDLDVAHTSQPTTRSQYLADRQTTETAPEFAPTRSFRVRNKSVDALSHDASRLAQDYQADIPNSPFGNANLFRRAEDDEGFMSDDNVCFRQESAAQVLSGTIFDAPTTANEASGSALFSPATSKPQTEKRTKVGQRPAPQTADSGYSSGGSLRVLERDQRVANPTRTSQVETHAVVARGSPEIQMPHQSSSALESTQSPSEDHRPMSVQIPDRFARSSISGSVLSPKSPHSVVSKSSFDSTSSAGPKRLQRRRSAHPEPPVVQSCQSIPEGTIPDIPDNVRANFTRRLSNTPGMECLTHTYESKDHVITSQPDVEAASTRPAEVFAQLTELEPERPATPPPHGRRQSLSLFRRKSMVETKDVDHGDENASPSFVDLGTIASSLGSSPYDAAMSKPLHKPVTSPTHPHQLGARLPRAKSMVGMDSQAAAEFARMHSKDRALAEQVMPQQRRRSHHNLKLEVGEAKAAKRRPQSSLHDIPPVPSIDTSRMNVSKSAGSNGRHDSKSALCRNAHSRAKAQTVTQPLDKTAQNRQSLPQHNVDWEAHSNLWRQRRKSIGEGLRTHATFSEASASTVNSRITPQPREDLAAWGRFSGGLDYNYEGRSAGIGGSAGTRQLHSAASTKSLKWRHQYGVDLSDVPIMLQRA
ncbi:hypothetical protein EK21DRAFT_108553 [Setomelanomma holmii]|uniref:Uncharacterized protein n=1 Tax=Setomelanomma holmii TaxID=210430 RepID=A0A9P4HFZ4_9PLEO|nr:hypothetical protein EK21DRAFT_108553 [Setomelanomma holmii]